VGRGKHGTVENQTQVSPRSLEIASGDSHFPTASTTIPPLAPQNQAEAGSMKPNRTTNVLIKPDNYKS
jgi:hypothetical protein